MYGITGNIVSSQVYRTNARVTVCDYKDFHRVRVVGLSKGGRKTMMWISLKIVKNIRVKFIYKPDRPEVKLFQEKNDAIEFKDHLLRNLEI